MAGTALMGTVLVTTLTALSAHARQQRFAQRKIASVEALDQLVRDRFTRGAGFKENEHGVLLMEPRVEWSASVSSLDPPQLLCDVLTIRATTEIGGRPVEVGKLDLVIPKRTEGDR